MIGLAARRGVAARLAGGDPALEALFEAMPEAVLVDRAGRVLRANRAARAVLPDARPGVCFAALHPPAARPGIASALAAAFEGGQVQAAVPFTASALAERGGPPRAALLRLERRPAPEEAGRLDVLGRLAGGIAHDFNNLLTAIAASADAAAEAPATAPEEAARIRAAAARGADLVQRLLAFGRQQTLQPRGVDANGAVSATATLLARLLGSRIEVVVELERPGRAVRVDPVQLDRMLVNLAVNARDAMPGGGRLTLSTGHATLLRPLPATPEPIPPGRWVTITVADTGTGIAPEALPRIFEPFFTTRTAQAGTTGGTGLGLATVHGILRQSGGYLHVASTPGLGTAMTLHLPRWSGPAASAAPPATAPRHAGGGRVLLVEDDDMIRTAAERALQREGWEVLAAESAEAALDLLPAGSGGLAAIVSDIVMPGLDGAALVRTVRERLCRPDLPAILVSGYAAETQRAALDGLGARFLAKPYAMRDLAAALAAA